MANRNLQPLQFNDLSYEKDISGGMGSIEAHHPEHGLIGQIYWNTDPKYKAEPVGGVTRLDVDSDFRRKGLATHLYREAQKMDPTVQHARTQTPEGKKFAKAVGP